MSTENLHALRIQLRRYLHIRGIRKAEDDRVCCPHPGHNDAEFAAKLTEDRVEGDRIACEICATAWDIFDVEGFYSALDNNRSTFKRRIAAVTEILATVLPEDTPGIEKPITEMTDEELAQRKAATERARKETGKAKAEAQKLAEKERLRKLKERASELPFRVLGRADDGQAYFIGYQGTLEIMRLGNGITKEFLYLLADQTWWEREFQGGRSKVDMDSAKFFLIHEVNSLAFSLASLRGRGAWREPPDENAHVRLCYHDGVKTYGEPNPDRVYQRKAQMDMGLEVDPAPAETRSAMLHAAGEMSFETQADCARLLAWAALAPFCGALPWRPAGFLTGVSKSGKSTILNLVVTRLARPLFISGDSTAAFIRQEVGNDCTGVVIDEAESATESDRRRMNEHFALMRQSTSDDAPRIGKGTTTGRAVSYMTRSMFLYSAISPAVEREADANRMFIVDLAKPSNDWRKVRACVAAAFTLENCAAVRAFTWAHLLEIIDGTQAIAAAIQDVAGLSSRDALLEAILWSAHWRVWKDRFPEDAELHEWLGTLYTLKRPEQPMDDSSALMQRLLTEVVQLQDAPSRRYTIEHLALSLATGLEEQPSDGMPGSPLKDEDKFRRTLNLYGLYVPTRGEHAGCLAVSVNHPWIARTIGMSSQYAKTLCRHPLCIQKAHTVTPTGETSRKCMIFNPLVLGGEGAG